jgi:hypothetical protein
MTDERPRTSVTCHGSVSVRQRPALLLMKLRLRATGSTLELRLADLKRRREAASRWLQRLGAARVDFGEPYFPNLIGKDPLSGMRDAAGRALGSAPAAPAAPERGQEVSAVLTATWPIAALSPEETLVLVDQLRFEAATEAGAPEPPDEPPAWASPQERLHEMMAHLRRPQEDDGTPQFLFIARMDEEQREKAAVEAFARARQNAERLARAAGMGLGPLASVVQLGLGAVEHVRGAARFMERQRCAALLAGTSYDLAEQEAVTDDPRSAEFIVSVTVSYFLQPPSGAAD